MCKIFDNLQTGTYDESELVTFSGLECIRRHHSRDTKIFGDGKHFDDIIYVFLKGVLDNSINQFRMNAGKDIEVQVEGRVVEVRDYGHGIPLSMLPDCVSTIKSQGIGSPSLRGLTPINALSKYFIIQSFCEDKTRRAEFKQGKLVKDSGVRRNKTGKSGTYIAFEHDDIFFHNFAYKEEYIEKILRNYSYFNTELNIYFNDKKFFSKDGLLDFLNESLTSNPLYPIIHLKGENIEIAFTHCNQHGEMYYSFVNGEQTTEGGTHQSAFRKSLPRTIKEFYKKTLKISDIQNGIIAAIAINIEDPIFESYTTSTKLYSNEMSKHGVTLNKYIYDFLKKDLDLYLYRNTSTVEIILQKISESKKENGIQR